MVRLSLLTLVLAWKGVSSFTVPPLRSATTASVDSSSSNKKSSNNSSSRLYLARRKSSAEAPKDKSDDSAESSAKKAALDGVLNQIERAYGRGSVMRLGDAGQMKVSMISTGSLTLDAATGGGYPRGRVVEIYGPESSGKTTLALHAIAQVQKEGGTAAFIDAEHALDPSYAAGCGVMVDDLLVSQPDSGEMALDVVDQLVRSAAVDVIVVDSVAALVPRAELEGDMSDTQIGLQARLMSKAMRKITGSLALSQCTVIFLNQLRSKVGVIYGSPEVTSGGNALKFYASIRLDTRRKEIMADNAGIRIKVKVVKNKVAAPFKVVMLDVLFGSGVDFWGGMLDAAVELEVVQRRGSWYAYRGENLAQGRPRCIELIKADPKLAEIMEADVRAAMANIGGEANDEPIAPAAVAETGLSEEISAPATASLTEETSYLE
jgi:recombination protein RecA